METNTFLSANDVIYKDLLLKIEDNPTPQTIKRLHAKIDELEGQLLKKTKAFEKQELELHQQHDQKKEQWIMKYIEAKLQSQQFKTQFEDEMSTANSDAKNMYHAIEGLIGKIRSKDRETLELLGELEKEVSIAINASMTLTSQRHQFTGTPGQHHEGHSQIDLIVTEYAPDAWSHTAMNKGKKKILTQRSFVSCEEDRLSASKRLETYENREISKEKLEDTSILIGITDIISQSNKKQGESAYPFFTPKGNSNRIKLNIPEEKENILTSSSNKTPNNVSNVSSSIYPLLNSVQKKIKGYMTEISESRAIQEVKFNSEINSTLQKVKALINRDSSPNKSQSNSNRKPEISTKFQSIIDNNMGSKENPDNSISICNILNKILRPDDDLTKKTHHTVEKLMEDLHQNLTFSEKEQVLVTLLNKYEHNDKTGQMYMKDVKLDELLAVSYHPNSFSVSNLFPKAQSRYIPPFSAHHSSIHQVNQSGITNNVLNQTMVASEKNSKPGSFISFEAVKNQFPEATPQTSTKKVLPATSEFKRQSEYISNDASILPSELKKQSTPGLSNLKKLIGTDKLSPIMPFSSRGQEPNMADFDEGIPIVDARLDFSEKMLNNNQKNSNAFRTKNQVKHFQIDEYHLNQPTEDKINTKSNISLNEVRPSPKVKSSPFCVCSKKAKRADFQSPMK